MNTFPAVSSTVRVTLVLSVISSVALNLKLPSNRPDGSYVSMNMESFILIRAISLYVPVAIPDIFACGEVRYP